ncbi:hypothetical protein CEXT_754561 [Caerostris extrusa]|uniref:Uncharacterized protein n=1 Tax=Caerostris extrusa TaxID=172846 RepID=A0AAV4NSS3_CAEEX|nr:hypothetical protein CEXT_754561 [Caerostris extrusa]
MPVLSADDDSRQKEVTKLKKREISAPYWRSLNAVHDDAKGWNLLERVQDNPFPAPLPPKIVSQPPNPLCSSVLSSYNPLWK